MPVFTRFFLFKICSKRDGKRICLFNLLVAPYFRTYESYRSPIFGYSKQLLGRKFLQVGFTISWHFPYIHIDSSVLLQKKWDKYVKYFFGIAILGILLALGGHTPFYRLVYLIPGVSKLRAPSMFFIFAHFLYLFLPLMFYSI